MNTVQGIAGQSYTAKYVSKQMNKSAAAGTMNSQDRYICGSGSIPEEEQRKKLTDRQAEELAERYDLQNMDRSQFAKMLAELRDADVLTEQEFSVGYAGTMPDYADGAPVWPKDAKKTDFLRLIAECTEYCKKACADSADGNGTGNETLAKTYSNLNAALVKISSKQKGKEIGAGESLPADEASDLKESPAAMYGDKAVALYELLKQDQSFANNSWRHCTSNPVARELAKEVLLSDHSTMEIFAKELWIKRAQENQFRIENNYLDNLYYLPKDYTGVVDEIRSKLASGSEDDITEILSEYDAFLSRKAKQERLTDVERLLSGFAESHEKSTWQNFDERMESVQNLIKKDFNEAGYSFDANKTYQFYLDTKTFTFSVTGGTEDENALIANAINMHPTESYKFDPLHTTLMALYGSRREDLSYNPWQINSLSNSYKDNLLKKYGVATDVPANYTKKMKQFIAAYQMHELDSNMKCRYGFGVDEISYMNGRLEGKTERAREYLAKLDDEIIREMGAAYRNILGKYTGTPEFESAVFVLENGKFKITYEQ